MGAEISAGQLFRPLDAPRPAELTARTPPGGQQFQTYLDDARTPKPSNKAESPQHDGSVREPKPVARKKTDNESPESAESPVDQPSADQTTIENNPSDSPVVESAAPAAPVEAPAPPVQPQASTDPVAPSLAIIQQAIVAEVPAPQTAEINVKVDTPISKNPEPSATTPTQKTKPLPVHKDAPVAPQTPAAVIPEVETVDEGEPALEPTIRPPVRQESSSRREGAVDPIGQEKPDVKGFENVFVKAEPSLIPEQRPITKPVEEPDPKIPVQKSGRIAATANRSARTDIGQATRPQPLDPGPRHKEIGRADPYEPPVEAHDGTQRRPVTVRSGSGDSAAATVGRFLIETRSDGEPSTANVPPPTDVRPTSVSGVNPVPHRTTAGSSGGADVTVTTLSRLLVSGTDGSDAIDAAAKVLAGSQRAGNHQVTLQLDPPELGQLRLDIRMEQQDMTLRVAADNAAVAKLIESRLSELRDALAVHGIRIDRSDVVVRSNGSENANPQTSQHGGSSNTADNGNRPDQPNVTWSDDQRWGASRDDQSGTDRQPGSHVAAVEDEEPSAASSWEPVTEGAEAERTWVDLVA